MPEEDAVPEALTARQLARYQATLAGVEDRDDAVERALHAVDLTAVADRPLGGFSKGMRQRGKVAAALVTDPDVLVLDEPLNGADPVQRLALIELFRALGAPSPTRRGRTVIVSSHVLHEVERLADRVIVLLHGRLAAAGGHRAIRDAMADRPRRVLLRSDDDRRLAAHLVALDPVTAVELGTSGLTVATSNAGALASALPGAGPRQRAPAARGPSPRRIARERVRGAHPMTATTGRAIGPSLARFPALVAYVFRACLPRKRLAVLLLPCAAIVGSGLLTPTVPEPAADAFARIAGIAIFGLAMPLGALVIGDAVLGAEVRSGTFAFTWLTPSRFGEIAVARWLGGWIVAAVTLVPASALAAVLAGVPDKAPAMALATAAGVAAHVALFVLVGGVTRRAAVWSLADRVPGRAPARRRALRRRPAVADVGGPGRLRRARRRSPRHAPLGDPRGMGRRHPARCADGRVPGAGVVGAATVAAHRQPRLM